MSVGNIKLRKQFYLRIFNLEFMNKFYNFIVKFEHGIFLQYLDDIKDLITCITKYLDERQPVEEV